MLKKCLFLMASILLITKSYAAVGENGSCSYSIVKQYKDSTGKWVSSSISRKINLVSEDVGAFGEFEIMFSSQGIKKAGPGIQTPSNPTVEQVKSLAEDEFIMFVWVQDKDYLNINLFGRGVMLEAVGNANEGNQHSAHRNMASISYKKHITPVSDDGKTEETIDLQVKCFEHEYP